MHRLNTLFLCSLAVKNYGCDISAHFYPLSGSPEVLAVFLNVYRSNIKFYELNTMPNNLASHFDTCRIAHFRHQLFLWLSGKRHPWTGIFPDSLILAND